VHRRFLAAIVALSLALGACAGESIADPSEIVSRGFESLLELNSFTATLELSGTVSTDSSGPSFNLAGTSLSAGIDLGNKRMAATFAVPALFGLSGEARVLDGDAYYRTTMSGPTWFRQPLDDDAVGEAHDPAAVLAEIRDFLSRDGVELRKLEDSDCGDETCYRVQLAVPSSLLDDAAGELDGGDGSVSEVIGPALIIDMLFDQRRGYLRQAATSIENPEMGSLTLTLTLDDFDEPVVVEAPPESEVQDADDGGFFQP
jgi:hypothetical protein